MAMSASQQKQASQMSSWRLFSHLSDHPWKLLALSKLNYSDQATLCLAVPVTLAANVIINRLREQSYESKILGHNSYPMFRFATT